ncbi:MAG TPA: glycoside hydrolase family 73 protein [Streptosporangiaceae bacterium]|nr:glycoside hydrolase family 73 protein [Streptosporangiaceae bacterium]
MPVQLLALEKAAKPVVADDTALRSAIVNVTNYYLQMARSKSPGEMEAIIWQHDSVDGVDHGESCAAFASLTLELAAQVVGQQSWVTGGTSYPWPLHKWADVRVDPNPASLGIISILQDAEAHNRWHPLGDGYKPLPGDWVLFDGHVEVVTKYAGGVLYTVGGDSLPNFSVNAHEYSDPLDAQGVIGFVNNGTLSGAAVQAPGSREQVSVSGGHQGQDQESAQLVAIPGESAVGSLAQAAGVSGLAAAGQTAAAGSATIPGAPVTANRQSASSSAPSTSSAAPASSVSSAPPASSAPSAPQYSRHHPSLPATPVHDTNAQQAFIDQVAPGAIATQRKYGVPAAVTIAQAIDESGWGQSELATKDNNLFGIKGTGPAGSDLQPTQEYQNGQWVTTTASFRVYRNVTESIEDHGRLLAGTYYRRAMADRQSPNAFATALTGVYATDPGYGANLIALMRQYNLYRYDIIAPVAASHAATPGGAAIPGLTDPLTPTPSPSTPLPTPSPSTPTPSPSPSTPTPTPSPSMPTPTPSPSTTPSETSPGEAPEPAWQSAAYQPLPQTAPSAQTIAAKQVSAPASSQARRITSRNAARSTSRYQEQIPQSVRNAFVTMARAPLVRAEPLYRDVARYSGISWELLAACDWMQCEARSRYSPVHGEKLGTLNPDGTIYRTKSEALEQCANDLVELARAVYQIDLTAPEDLSVRDLANVFAAFRWGGLLKLHHTSAMEFPYSVAGLTAQHVNMRWPNIAEPNAPDKPGSRFRRPFGAVPIVLGLNYPATV